MTIDYQYTPTQYKCPKCDFTGSREQVHLHCHKEHEQFIGMSSPLWNGLIVKDKTPL